MVQKFVTFVLAVWLSVMLAACDTAAPFGQPAASLGDVVVTLRVADAEEYRIRLTDPDDIGIAQKLLAGQSAPRIPNGRVVRGE
jgi:predicted small secreted protein